MSDRRGPLAFAVVALATACSSPSPPPPKEQPAAPDARPAAPDPPPSPIADLPVECGLYKALVAKLATCEQLGPQRDLLVGQFETSWKAWADLPVADRGNVATSCRAAADAVRAAASGPCAW